VFRFTARSTTPGEYRWKTYFFGGIVDGGNVISGVDRGDGVLGNNVLPGIENVRDDTTFGANNTQYTGLIVLPLEKDVRLGVDYDIVDTIAVMEGTLSLPSIADVEQGVTYGNLSIEYTGTFICDYPDIINVRSGIEYSEGDMIGTLNLPSINDVQEDVVFDNSTKTGVLDLPLVSLVVDGTTFGANAEYTGTYEDGISPADVAAASDVRYGTARYVGGDNGTAYIPTAANVISGVNVDNTVGVFVVPAVSNVLDDVTFGANNTQYTGTVVLPSESDVRQGVTFGAP